MVNLQKDIEEYLKKGGKIQRCDSTHNEGYRIAARKKCPTEKQCTSCKRVLPISEFFLRRTDTYYARCKDCKNGEGRKRRRKANAEKRH